LHKRRIPGVQVSRVQVKGVEGKTARFPGGEPFL
jgi:hypothetical protein